jgi:glycerol-3-phosphate acyltransferase PlsY
VYRLISIVIGYFFGCFQSAFIIGKIREHIDIREYGSGNSGTTNAIRVMGWRLGLLTFLGDFIKAIVAVLIVTYLYDSSIAGLYAGLGVIIGHNWPVFLKFKGGKGIASTVGMLYGVDYRIGISVMLIMIIVVGITRFVSLGSILMAISIPILMYVFVGRIEYVIVGGVLAIFALYRHKSNIKRLLAGNENKLGHKKSA